MKTEVEEKKAKLDQCKSPKNIALLMGGFGLFSIANTGLSAGVGASLGCLSSKYGTGNYTLTPARGAAMGALTMGIPLALAWLSLPCVIMTWVACKMHRMASPETKNCLTSTFAFGLVLLSTMMTAVATASALLAKPIAHENPTLGMLLWTMIVLGLLALTGRIAATALDKIDKCQSDNEESQQLLRP